MFGFDAVQARADSEFDGDGRWGRSSLVLSTNF
jgi:hypothetical protein